MVQISLINCLLFLNISVLSVIWLYTKNLLFWTLQKSNQYFVFKTTYLFSKVIVPKHKNWRWIRQRAFQDPSSPARSVLDLSLCLVCLLPTLDEFFELVTNTRWLVTGCTILQISPPLAGRGEYNMDFGGGMYPVWLFQLITTIANWSLQVELSTWGSKGTLVCSSYIRLEQSAMRITLYWGCLP